MWPLDKYVLELQKVPETVRAMDLPDIREVVSFLKTLTDVPFVVGGPGYSLFPVTALQYLGIEFGEEDEKAAAPAAVR